MDAQKGSITLADIALPDYESPPVVEVAIGMQYSPLEDLRAAHVGLYWGLIKDEFPKLEERAPLPHRTQEAEPSIRPRSMRIQLTDSPELPRSWFLTSSESRLLQLQRDRFVMNWRKVAQDSEYPRYPKIRDEFRARWKEYVDFLSGQSIGEPSPDLLELTYVNLIPRGEGWERISEAGNVFLPFTWKTRDGFLSKPKTIRTAMSFALPEHKGQLAVELYPISPEGEEEKLRLSLSATGYPTNLNDDSVWAWFDLAREWIVRGFADLVAPMTDELWGRKA